MKRLFATVVALSVTVWAGAAVAEQSITELPVESGGIQRVLYAAPQNPHAILIMLLGGSGIVEFSPDSASNRIGAPFLLRTLPLWQSEGFAVAVLASPNGRSLFGYRHTPAYAATIGEAVDFVHTRAKLPVFLVGTSQGTTAAVGGAARLGRKLAGIVLMSSVTGRSSAGETLFDSEPGRVAVPVLIVSNSGDTCPVSPPSDAPKIAAALTAAPRKDILRLQSATATTRGPPCDAGSPHSYVGIEQEAVARVSAWIRSVSEPD